MAKDILAILISGVGVERLFNTAQDICHYQHHQLDAQTIRMLMIFRHYNKLLVDNDIKDADIKANVAISIDKVDKQLAKAQHISDDEGDNNVRLSTENLLQRARVRSLPRVSRLPTQSNKEEDYT